MFLHADAVSQNRSARVGTRRIHSDYAYAAVVFAIEARKLIDQRALPCSGRPSQSQHARLSAVLKQRLEQLGPSRCAVLHGRDSAGQRTNVAGAKLLNPCLDGLVQAISVKQRRRKTKSAAEFSVLEQLPCNH